MSDAPSRLRSGWLLWASIGTALVVLAAVVVVVALAPSPRAESSQPDLDGAIAHTLSINQLSTLTTKAPAIALTDQRGNPVTLAQFEGKSVVLTFNDDQCEDLCTLLAQDVLAANNDLGTAAQHVVFLSVNANPYYPAVAAVNDWTSAHGLAETSNWYFGTGTPDQLAALWSAYDVTVQGDSAARTVTHGEEMFFIDPSGHERYLGEFGTQSANTAVFASATAAVAVGLLPAAQRVTIAQPARPSHDTRTGLGDTPASITLPVLGTSEVKSAVPGKFTVLNFWASNCSACITEAPAIEKAYTDQGAAFRFYGIDVSDTPRLGQAFALNAGDTYPEFADRKGTVAGQFQITGLPYTVILDPKGSVVVRHAGALTTQQLDYLLETLKTQFSE